MCHNETLLKTEEVDYDYGFDDNKETGMELVPTGYESGMEKTRIMITVTSEFLDLAEKAIKIASGVKSLMADQTTSLIPDAVYTEEEICRFLKVNRKTLRKMINEERLHAFQINDDDYRIMGKSVLAFFEPEIVFDSIEDKEVYDDE